MKITNYVIVFMILTITVMYSLSYRVSSLTHMTTLNARYNRNIDNALLDAVNDVVEVDDGSVYLNEDECVKDFFDSLYASFGIKDDEAAQAAFRAYVPALVIAENDGFYVRYNTYSQDSIKSVWSIKFPYAKSFELMSVPGDVSSSLKYSVDYCLDDTVRFVLSDGRVFSGPREDVVDLYRHDPDYALVKALAEDSKLLDSKYYLGYKDEAVTEAIVDKMNYYANLNNDVAQAFGISYHFQLPEDASSELSRAIDDVSVVALFQGLPYGVGTDDVYSKFAVAGARVRKGDRYYVRACKVEGGYGALYYHRKDCTWNGTESVLSETGYQYRTKEEAAMQGAYPCPYCKP